MEESANKDAFLDRLRSVHDALEAGRNEVALELLVEMREQGFGASNLDDQIALLREDPDERDVVEVDRWVQNLVGQMQRPDDEPFASLEEVTGADAEPMGAKELMPLSESSEVGIELQESPEEVPDEGVGSDVHGSVGEESLMDQETGAGFDRDSQPATAVGEGSAAQDFGADSEISEVDLEEEDDGFDGLPSVDFAVVESEADEDDGFEADDELEPLEESPAGIDEKEPTAAGAETDDADGGDGEDDVFVQDMFSQGADDEPDLEDDDATGSAGDPDSGGEVGPELDTESDGDEDVFIQDMFGDQTSGESSLDQEEATEANGEDDEAVAPSLEPEVEAGEDDELVQGMFDDEDSEDEDVEGLFEDESTSAGIDGESSGFELNFGGDGVEEEEVDGGDPVDMDAEDSDEWSALDAFESSELEADDSDFVFDDDPSTAVGQDDVDTAVGEQDPETAVGEQKPAPEAGGESPGEMSADVEPSSDGGSDDDLSFGFDEPESESDTEAGGDGSSSDETSEEDLSFGFDEQDSQPEIPAGRDISFGSAEEDKQEVDPNQTRQPFSEDSEEAAEQFAQQHFDDSSDGATRAGSVEELVGEDNAALFRDDEEPDEAESSGGAAFQDEESTSKNDMPDHEPPEPPPAFEDEGSTAQTGTPDPGADEGPETSPPDDDGPDLFDDEEQTAKNDSPEASAGLEDGGEEFDLGFENPGEDDSAGFDLGFEEESEEEETHQTPVPDGNLSDLAEATGEAGVEESAGDEPSEPTNEAMNPFAADEGMDENSEPVPTGQDQESSPRYSMEASENLDEEAQQESSVETEENDALSDEEFFQLADELSEPSAASEPDDESPTPTPHRGEPAIPQADEPAQSGVVDSGSAMSDEEAAQSSGMSGGGPQASVSSESGEGAGSEQSEELAGINPHASATSEPEEVDEESGTGSYQSVPHDSSEAEEESRELESGAVQLINEAERLFEKGNLESAHDLVKSVLESSPNSERAQSLLESIEAEQEGDEPAATGEHQSVDSSQPPPLDAVPQSEVDMAEVADQDFDHRFGFILSLVDGTVTVQDICELSSMSRQETLSVLADMVDQSFISVDE